MIKKIFSVIVLMLLVSSHLAIASNGIQVDIPNARSLGMANSMQALADDWSALFTNPAGLTQAEGNWTIGWSNGIVMPEGSYAALAYPQNQLPFSGMDLVTNDLKPHIHYIPTLALIYNYSDKFTFGFGISAPFGLGTEWDLIDMPETYGNATDIADEYETYSNLKVINFQPTAAMKVTDKLSMGLGLSLMYATLDLDVLKIAYNPVIATWPGLTESMARSGVTLPELTSDQYRILIENSLSGNGFGFGANFGLHYQANKKLSFGFTARYFTDLALSGGNRKTLIRYGDEAKTTTLLGVPATPVSPYASDADPTGENTKQYHLDMFSGTNLVSKSDADADVPLPVKLGLGIAYRANWRWNLALDVSWTQWENWDVIDIDIAQGDNMQLKKEWINTIEYGGGIEFMATRKLAIRTGYYSAESPSPAETMTPTIPDPAPRQAACLGLGYDFGQFKINLAGEYILFDDATVDSYVFDTSTGITENYAGNYEFNVLTFVVSAEVALDQLLP